AEGQLRDDADYTATMIMNAFYSYPFDYVRDCGNNCIELVDSIYTSLEKKDLENQTFYSINQEEEYKNEKLIRVEIGEKTVNGEKINVFMVDGKPIDSVSDFGSKSSISLSCPEYQDEENRECENGMIS